jgi:hypothetical protein
VITLLAEGSAEGREELARIAKNAFTQTDVDGRRLLLDDLEEAIKGLYCIDPEERVRTWKLSGIDPTNLDPTRPTDRDLLDAAGHLRRTLAWDLPGIVDMPADTIVDLLRRLDPKSAKPIGAPYAAAVLCVRTRALGLTLEQGEEIEDAARRQAPYFRHARGARERRRVR